MLLIVLAVVVSIREIPFRKEYEPPTALANELPRFRVIDLDKISIYADIQKKILDGAKKQLEVKAKNIFLLEDEPNYYKGGDPPEDLAICTDIVARALREAGYDLRELVYQDIKNNFEEYPLREIWNQYVCDPDIDYRRIQNLEIFFKRNANILPIDFNPKDKNNLELWLPGDIVFFDMNRDGFSDNVGIISDSTTREGIPKVIYNYTEPGYTIEKDILGKKTIKGHYRFPK